MNVVFDTNVFVSGFTKTEGRAGQALAKIAAGIDHLFISQLIVEELLRVLTNKFRWSSSELKGAMRWLEDNGRLIFPTETLAVLADEPDNRVLECALSADTEVIVTGDRAMLALGEIGNTRIISLSTYLDVDNPFITPSTSL